MKIKIFTLAILCFVYNCFGSEILVVPDDYSTIQQAINSASNGDIIEVSPGTYTGDGNRDIDFKGKAITVRSSSGAGQTTIDCTGNSLLHSNGPPQSRTLDCRSALPTMRSVTRNLA